MVNTGLDRKYVASSRGAVNYDPVPDGEYRLRVKEVDPWKESKKTIQVIQKDENGNVLYTGSIDTSCGGLTEKAIIKWNEQHGRTSNVWDATCWEEAFPK